MVPAFTINKFDLLICYLDVNVYFQCQVVLQGKSRNLIIRELQRTVSLFILKKCFLLSLRL